MAQIQTVRQTKLQQILYFRSLSHLELIRLIEDLRNDQGKLIGRKLLPSQISRIVSGRHKNPTLAIILLISKALNVKMEDIIEDDILEQR